MCQCKENGIMRVELEEFESCKPDDDRISSFSSVFEKAGNEDVNSAISEAARLGAYINERGEIQASHWVGVVWIEQPDTPWIFRVRPKRQSSGPAVELRLLEKCLSFPQIASRLFSSEKKVFEWWPEQTKIELESCHASGLVFLIIHYLHELQQLCRRHIKRKFPRVTRNLTAKVKGRIDIAGNIRSNTSRGRPDRVCCNFNIHSMDILENRILKAALEVSRTFLRGHSINSTHIWSMVRECDTALAPVSTQRIFPRHFSGLTLSGTMKAYKTPMELAMEIIKNLGSDPDFEKIHRQRPVFPYAINMNELFERYCEALLRGNGIAYKDNEQIKQIKPDMAHFWAGDSNLGKKDVKVKVRPDFLFLNQEGKAVKAVIADAKYKYAWPDRVSNEEGNTSTRPDVYQVIAYSRHNAVIKKLGKMGRGDKKKPGPNDMKIFIFYPCIDAKDDNNQNDSETGAKSSCDVLKDFEIEICACPIPL